MGLPYSPPGIRRSAVGAYHHKTTSGPPTNSARNKRTHNFRFRCKLTHETNAARLGSLRRVVPTSRDDRATPATLGMRLVSGRLSNELARPRCLRWILLLHSLCAVVMHS